MVALESQTGCGAHPAPIRVPTSRQPGREVDQSPPASDVVKNEWRSTSTPPICLHDVNKDNFTCLTTFRESVVTYVCELVPCDMQLTTADCGFSTGVLISP